MSAHGGGEWGGERGGERGGGKLPQTLTRDFQHRRPCHGLSVGNRFAKSTERRGNHENDATFIVTSAMDTTLTWPHYISKPIDQNRHVPLPMFTATASPRHLNIARTPLRCEEKRHQYTELICLMIDSSNQSASPLN